MTPGSGAPVSVVVEALGVPIAIRIAGAETPLLHQGLEHAWSSCLTARPAEAVVQTMLDDPADYDRVMERITQQVTLEAITTLAGQVLMFHACAVADPETGAAVVLVGPSGMGKTTMSTTLGRHWGYVTDETAAIHDDRSLLTYPKPLSITSTRHPGKDQFGPAELGLLPSPDRRYVTAVLLLDRRPADDEHPSYAAVEHVPNVPAIAMLAEHTSYLTRMERPLQRIAELLRVTGGLRRVSYTEAGQVVPVVAELLEGPR